MHLRVAIEVLAARDYRIAAGQPRVPGEVTVDYALRLKRELAGSRLWVTAYANAMPCYICSKRLLGEGGYEVDSSMVSYGQPSRLASEAEDKIIHAVKTLVPPAFAKEGSR